MVKYKFDGAFGTYYTEIGGREEVCERANLSDPETVARIHREYADAGANAIKTNTYQANTLSIPDRVELRNIITSGFKIAAAAAPGAEIFADIGNICSEADVSESAYLEVAEIFIDCGAKNYLFETLDDIEPVLKVMKFIRARKPDSTIITSFAVSEDGYTRLGRNYSLLIKRALEAADFAGMNCICGPSVMLRLAEGLNGTREGVDYRRLSVMPNASYPSLRNGRMTYVNNPDYYASKLIELAGLGIGAVGGCCGTSPGHMKRAYEVIENAAPVVSEPKTQDSVIKNASFYEIFDYNKKLIAVELNPPATRDDGFINECAHRFKAAGADALTLTDSPLARVRADSLAMSARFRRELGIQVLPHLTCRDRNRIAIKSGLLAASLDGVDSLLAVTGDSPDEDFRAQGAKSVYNLNSFGLISYVNNLNTDVFADSPYYIAAALNVNASNFASELKRAEKKLSLGASMLMTQAMFTEESVENLKTAREYLDCRILAGIMPLAGYKNAVFLSNEVGGITIPQELVEELRDASPENVRKISLGFAEKIIRETWEYCDGYYIMFPLKRAELAEALIGHIKRLDDKNKNMELMR